jgi:sodium-dependent dicarboxylate transporter 2/3/5
MSFELSLDGFVVFEAVPIFVTALLPIVLFPAQRVFFKLADGNAAYAGQLFYFYSWAVYACIGRGKSIICKRIALNLIRLTGTKSDAIMLLF